MPNSIVYTNNQNYQDIANAIRAKNGSNTLYYPAEMADAINALVVTGETITYQTKTVTPTTSEQEITADSGYNALSKVTVSPIPNQYIIPSGSITITENGTTNVAQYASATVNVPSGSEPPVLEEEANITGITAKIISEDEPLTLGIKTITASGIYNASTDGYNGYSQVTVDAPIPTGTVVSKTVGEGQSISKGDFVTWNNNLLQATPPDDKRSYQASTVSLCEYELEDDSVGYRSVVLSHAGSNNSQTCFTVVNAKNNQLQYWRTWSWSNQGWWPYGRLINLDHKKIFYSGRRGTQYFSCFCWENESNNVMVNIAQSSATPYPGMYGDSVKLSNTSILSTYGTSSGLMAVILTINGTTITKGTPVLLTSDTQAYMYHSLSPIDETHVIIGLRSGSNIIMKIIVINDGVPSLSEYSYALQISYVDYYRMIKLNSTSILATELVNNNYCLQEINWDGTSLSLNKTLYSSSLPILGIAIGSNTIGILKYDDASCKLKFVLLDINNATFIEEISIADHFRSNLTANVRNLLICQTEDRYIAGYSNTSPTEADYWATVSLINWDGTELHYKNDYLESYNGESLYGIALEDGEAGDTIQVLIPNAPEKNTEGE